MEYLLAGKEKCDFLVIGITNSDSRLIREDPSDERRSKPSSNPLTYFERLLIIQDAFMNEGIRASEFCITPFPINVPELIKYYVPMDAIFFLRIYDAWGEKKYKILKSLGLNLEILWRRSKKVITGTEVRNRIAQNKPWEHLVPPATVRVIKQFNIDIRIKKLLGEEDHDLND
jgi:nicotinamide-nucleotide adenylyltransferase